MLLWHTLGTFFRLRHGKRIQKIPLDAASSCPNRDGRLSTQGCLFCNAQGSGSGMGAQSFATQWQRWHDKYTKTDSNRAFMAYIQSFSNTYGSVARLRALLQAVQCLPNCMGLALGTRPDCLNEEKLALLASFRLPCPQPELWLELGLQSMHDATLARINRQHTAAQSEAAVRLAAAHGIQVCAHLMAGLPGEDERDFQQSVLWASALPIAGLKLHNVYVCKNTGLEALYRAGAYFPLSRDEYVDMLAHALPFIPSHIVMHRLTGDPAPDELCAPAWAEHKRPLLTDLHHALTARGLWQGCKADVTDKCPLWYGR
jgi:uncharacterized protein